MKKLYSVPSLRGLLPFVRCEKMRQECSTESFKQQGDPLMPLLFSLAFPDPLAEAQRECGPQEHLFAFLDDVYATSDVPDRTRTLYDSLGTKLHAQAGIRLHGEDKSMEQSVIMSSGGCRVGTGSVEPRRCENLGNTFGFTEVCRQTTGGRTEAVGRNPNGAGFAGSVADPLAVRRPEVPPHVALPPSQSEVYAQGHDSGMER